MLELRPLLALALCCALSACGARTAVPDVPAASSRLVSPTEMQDSVTDVVVLGAVGDGHLRSAYRPAVLAAAIRRFDPDVVLVEIAPAEMEAALREMSASDDPLTMSGAWASQPELYAVVVPLAEELGYTLVPISAWTAAARADRDAYFDAHPQGPRLREYQIASAIFHAGLLQHGYGDAEWLHSDEFLEITTTRSRWLSYGAETALGAGGELRLHAAHAALLADALRAHAGARALVVFDVESRWYLEPAIDALPNVHRFSATDFLAP